MSVKNIPSERNSQLRDIFPVVYCYSGDAKSYGFQNFLEPLNYRLESTGKWCASNDAMHDILEGCLQYELKLVLLSNYNCI